MQRPPKTLIENLDYVLQGNRTNAPQKFLFEDFVLEIRYEKSGHRPKVKDRKLKQKGEIISFRLENRSLRLLQYILQQEHREVTDYTLTEELKISNPRNFRIALNKALGKTKTGEDFLETDRHQGIKFNGNVIVEINSVKKCESLSDAPLAYYKADDFVATYKDYAEQIEVGCQTLSEAPQHERWKKREFLIALAKVSLSKTNGKIQADVEIPIDPMVAITKEQRRRMEHRNYHDRTPYPASKEITELLESNKDIKLPPMLMRMSAGGCIAILRCPKEDACRKVKQTRGTVDSLQSSDYEDYVILCQKDSDSPSYNYDLSPASGISENLEHFDNSLLVVVGEFAEEIRILKREKGTDNVRWYHPQYGNADFRRREASVRQTRKQYVDLYQEFWADEILDYPLEKNHKYMPVTDVEIISLGNDKLSVKFGSNDKKEFFKEDPNDENKSEGHLLVVDPQVGALDLMVAIRMKLKIPLSELSIMDGEATLKTIRTGEERKEMKLLNRNIFAFTKDELRNFFEGRKSKAKFFGRDEADYGRWKENLTVELGTDWQISRPGYFTGIALLKNFFKFEGLKPELKLLSQNTKKTKPPTVTPIKK